MKDTQPILCFGEIVWDAMPSGIYLGGAPLNVAFHLNQLGHPALPVSRIGDDFLGRETLRRLKAADVAIDLIQADASHETGAVLVELDESGDASYEILEPAAWDFIRGEEKLMEQARAARALVYGSLATRSPGNARLLGELLDRVPLSLCDVNLRKPYDDPENAIKWASRATIVKLNDEELDRLSPEGDDGLEDKAAALAARLGVRTLVVTRGGKGAFVFHEGKGIARPAPEVEVADTVGAGDAFTAGFLGGFLESGSVEEALEEALELGAFVAGRSGAQPAHERRDHPGD